jgi:hypothetical protein
VWVLAVDVTEWVEIRQGVRRGPGLVGLSLLTR